MLTPAQARTASQIEATLRRMAAYDDESVVHETWIRQRYATAGFATYAPARRAAVVTAWHEAGHAVAALATGAPFTSASIRHGRDSSGRVHGIRGAADTAFVIDAAGQIAERLRDWTMLDSDEALTAWLPTWRADGGDARRFRRSIAVMFPGDEVGAWRHSEAVLVPLRPQVRRVARALLAHPRHLPREVVVALLGWS
jgi:hypothetical protein